MGKGELIRKCGKLILSDFSEGMLEQTRKTLQEYEGIDYQLIDVQKIPYADETFDVVIANMMLYHVPDLSKGLSEIRRVLKKGGKFYCATYGENGIMEYIYGLFENRVAKADYVYSLTGMSDLQKLPREELLKVLEANTVDGVLRVPKEYGMFVAR